MKLLKQSFSSTFFCVSLAALASVAAAVTLPAVAQTAPTSTRRPPSFLALGVASTPEYEGSRDRQLVPHLVGVVHLGPTTLSLNGIGAQLNVLRPELSGWSLGPSVQFRPGRDRDVEDPVIAQLRSIDDAVELGGFVEYAWASLAGEGDRLSISVEVLKDVNDAHDGVIGRSTVTYNLAPIGAWRLGVRAGVAYGSSDYMTTYFAVDPDNNIRSGLPQYRADGGIKDASLVLTTSYSLSSDWLITGFAGAARLMGDAADSPIVTSRGKRLGWIGGVALGRRF